MIFFIALIAVAHAATYGLKTLGDYQIDVYVMDTCGRKEENGYKTYKFTKVNDTAFKVTAYKDADCKGETKEETYNEPKDFKYDTKLPKHLLALPKDDYSQDCSNYKNVIEYPLYLAGCHKESELVGAESEKYIDLGGKIDYKLYKDKECKTEFKSQQVYECDICYVDSSAKNSRKALCGASSIFVAIAMIFAFLF